ncbi:MAG: Gfo/Idh/MocA family oxidoreductase [Planctomycetes bacterium]|nr:Gfo/Idh/MocA family oxidoreductase [Planctomycetota bacterium]
MPPTTRRRFLSRAAKAALLCAAPAVRLTGAAPPVSLARAAPSETIRAAVIGARGRGRVFFDLAGRKDAVLAALCDVDRRVLGEAAESVQKSTGSRPATHADFRRLLDDRSIDLVFVATPHHWHCPIAVRAIQAGKDVYVEKPASHVFREGRALVEAARKHGRIVQHGTQMRSSEVTARAGEVLASGLLGKVKMSKAWNVQRHRHPPLPPDADPPEGLDYDMWLGPAPARRFNPLRFHGGWTWFRDYGNGDIGNDGSHDIDMARWGLGVTAHPVRITAHGSRIDLEGAREFPDNMSVAYQYADDKVLLYEDRGWTPYGLHGFDSGNAFYGTEGYMLFSRRGYFQVYLGPKEEPGPGLRGGAGMPEHVAGFLDCVRTRKQPTASAEVAHLSCALVHLGEVAYRVGRVLRFDPSTERVLDDPEADRLLTKEHRAPWGVAG